MMRIYGKITEIIQHLILFDIMAFLLFIIFTQFKVSDKSGEAAIGIISIIAITEMLKLITLIAEYKFINLNDKNVEIVGINGTREKHNLENIIFKKVSYRPGGAHTSTATDLRLYLKNDKDIEIFATEFSERRYSILSSKIQEIK